MEEFRSYLPDAVILSNLSETAGRLAHIAEQERAHITELAAEILSEIQQPSDLLASLPDRTLSDAEPKTDVLPENQATVSQVQKIHLLWQRLLLCTELGRGLGLDASTLPELFFAESEQLSPHARGRVIYQKSNYADVAFRCFSKQIDNANATYTHNVTVVCEEVVRGNCEYCILPLENSQEGQLHSFSRLIDRHGLKIVASCNVPTDDKKRSTRFVLLRRDIPSEPLSLSFDMRFECVIPFSHSPSVAELLTAAEYCRLKIEHLNSGLYTVDGACVFGTHFVFSLEDGDLSAYLLFLAMQAPNFEIRGIYRQTDL